MGAPVGSVEAVGCRDRAPGTHTDPLRAGGVALSSCRLSRACIIHHGERRLRGTPCRDRIRPPVIGQLDERAHVRRKDIELVDHLRLGPELAAPDHAAVTFLRTSPRNRLPGVPALGRWITPRCLVEECVTSGLFHPRKRSCVGLQREVGAPISMRGRVTDAQPCGDLRERVAVTCIEKLLQGVQTAITNGCRASRRRELASPSSRAVPSDA